MHTVFLEGIALSLKPIIQLKCSPYPRLVLHDDVLPAFLNQYFNEIFQLDKITDKYHQQNISNSLTRRPEMYNLKLE